MAGLIFDIETNGFLPELTKIHTLALTEEGADDAEVRVFGGHTDEKIRNILTHLEDAPFLYGHNILEFDLPALKKVYPNFKPRGQMWDTLLDCQMMYTDMRDVDFKHRKRTPDFPAEFIGKHSLAAWGHRLGLAKGSLGEEENRFEVWSEEMDAYCQQDVVVTRAVLRMIKKSLRFSQQAHDMEMELKEYLLDQEREGFPFDVEAAKRLYVDLAAERAPLEETLAKVFQPWEVYKEFIPKRDNVKKGYVKDVPFQKKKMVTFNPRSHAHIANRLIAVRGWVPEEFTDKGAPCTDAEILEGLGKQWPECKLLARHAELQKVIGMISEGKSAYLKMVSPDGRLRGRIGTCTTVTGRCNHKEPNLGNIPRKGELGKRIRLLFTAIPGYSLVGSDAKGLELRMMGHFIARFDGGQYGKIVVEGDPHAFHQGLADLKSRDDAKTFIYGFIYGAGDAKIGLIISKGQSAGRALRLKFLKRFPALSKLKDAVAKKAGEHGYINGLDGRRLHVRAIYSSLNTLLQSAGALVTKYWVILVNREIRRLGLFQDGSIRQVAYVHDEIQALVKIGLEKTFEKICVDSMHQAGEHFGLRLPLDADTKIGTSWGDTH